MTDKTAIAVLVSGGGTNLQALIDAQAKGIIKSGEIRIVISSKRGVFALERARNAGIEALEIPRRECASQDEYESRIIDALKERNIGLIVLAGFLSVLSESFTSLYKDRIINVHPSLIPSFCGDGFYGLRVHEAALARGVKVTGATVHYVNEITDGGGIIMQKAVRILKNDTPETLQRRVMEQAEWIILPRACETVCSKINKTNSQNGRKNSNE